MALTQTLVTVTPVEIYRSTGTNAVVVAYFCNISAVPAQLSLYLVDVGGTASESNMIYKNLNLTAEDTYVLDNEKIILDNNQSLYASCSVADAVRATVNTIGV